MTDKVKIGSREAICDVYDLPYSTDNETLFDCILKYLQDYDSDEDDKDSEIDDLRNEIIELKQKLKGNIN